ncbi:MAG: hypothetical protein KC501_17880 [Myxococcales bacterium]|nr:hypothetical protein [Myxococcales bacterium]
MSSTLLMWMLAAQSTAATYEVSKKSDGTLACRENQVLEAPSPEDSLQLTIQTTGLPADTTVAAVEVGTVRLNGPGPYEIRKDQVDVEAVELKVELSTPAGTTVVCDKRSFFADPPPKGDEADDADPTDVSLDTAAAAWWTANGETKSKTLVESLGKAGLGRPFGRRFRSRDRKDTVFLVHLPSGAPASPFPSSVREGTILQVAVLRPLSEVEGRARSYSIEVESCAAVEPFRTTLENEAAPPEQAGAASRDGAGIDFTVVPIGPWMRCGDGKLEYTLRVTDPPSADGGIETTIAATTKVGIRPVHHLAAVAIPGFDTARLPSFGVRDGVIVGGLDTSTERFDRVGARVMVGAQWMIGGVDYEQMRWHNYFANLFVGVDATKPLDGFTTGLAITPTGGISLAVGLSLHKTRQLDDGLRVGDPFVGDGDVPSTGNWRDPSAGLFVGLAIDHRIYQALVARFR